MAARDALPKLPAATANVLLMLVTCVITWKLDTAARERDAAAVKKRIPLLLMCGVVMLLLRVREFHDLEFRWDSNAYGSMVWTLVGMHAIYLLIGVIEWAVTLLFLVTHG